MNKVVIGMPEGYELDLENCNSNEIRLRPIKTNYPISIEEVHGRYYYLDTEGSIRKTSANATKNHFSSKKRAKAFLALIQLVELRDAWNKIDGRTKFNFDAESLNHCIYVAENQIRICGTYFDYYVLHFRKEETRNLFFKTFKDLIEQAKELL